MVRRCGKRVSKVFPPDSNQIVHSLWPGMNEGSASTRRSILGLMGLRTSSSNGGKSPSSEALESVSASTRANNKQVDQKKGIQEMPLTGWAWMGRWIHAQSRDWQLGPRSTPPSVAVSDLPDTRQKGTCNSATLPSPSPHRSRKLKGRKASHKSSCLEEVFCLLVARTGEAHERRYRRGHPARSFWG